MPTLVKFKRGLGNPSTKEDGTFYINVSDGAIYLGNKTWYADGKEFINASVSTSNNQLIVTFVRRDNTTSVVPILKGINGAATTITIDNNGDIKVNVVLSAATTNGNNIIINDGTGLYTTIKPTYTNGNLQLQYYNGTAWANVGDPVNIHVDSFLYNSTFVEDQATYDAWIITIGIPAGSEPTATISGPSIIFVMTAQSGSTHSYDAIVTPVSDLYEVFTFVSSNTIDFSTTSASDTTNVTANVKFNANAGLKADAAGLAVALSTDANNKITFGSDKGLYVPDVNLDPTQDSTVALTSSSTGLKAGLNVTSSATNTVALSKGTSGLSGDVIIAPDKGIVANAGIGILTGANVAANESGINLFTNTNGLQAEIVWGEF
jgi:hypothetical protein